jgi:nucleoside-diphosphate-sugar epimerase
MNNLIIGSTSQLSYYFPSNFHKISSRNVDIEVIKNGNYDSVFILFAEQRTFLNESENFFTDVNFKKTLKLINEIKNYVNKIVIYSTSELWNKYDGKVSINDNFNYNYTPYIKSKQILCDYINEFRDFYSNVVIVYPFNFNSPYRKEGFLFSKIFKSLMNKEKCSVGNLNFNRDIIHPQIIVNNSMSSSNDILVGTGELINIEGFVDDIFNLYKMNYKDYILFDNNYSLTNKRNSYYSKIKYSSREELIKLTINDLQ